VLDELHALSKSDGILNDLGMQIVSGRLGTGAQPREEDLSRRLGISRASLREALKAVAVKGLVETRTRRGTSVNDKRRWDVLDADSCPLPSDLESCVQNDLAFHELIVSAQRQPAPAAFAATIRTAPLSASPPMPGSRTRIRWPSTGLAPLSAGLLSMTVKVPVLLGMAVARSTDRQDGHHAAGCRPLAR